MESYYLSSKLRKRLGIAATSILIYAACSLAARATVLEYVAAFEQFSPRERKGKSVFLKNLETVAEYSSVPFIYPWKLYGFVTPDRYRAVRNKAFEIAGIDENNPDDDEKRFSLYRKLGIAVSKSEDMNLAVYVPFVIWKNFIEKNSTYKFQGWEEWWEPTEKGKLRYARYLLGRAFFKADSESNGEDSDGLVNNAELKRFLEKIGSSTIDGVLSQNSPKRLNELESLIHVKIGPMELLEHYINSK